MLTDFWTRAQLDYTQRLARSRDSNARQFEIHTNPPGAGFATEQVARGQTQVALVLFEKSANLAAVESALVRRRIAFERTAIKNQVILTGLDLADTHTGNGLPVQLNVGFSAPLPPHFDGFD